MVLLNALLQCSWQFALAHENAGLCGELLELCPIHVVLQDALHGGHEARSEHTPRKDSDDEEVELERDQTVWVVGSQHFEIVERVE